MYDEKFRKEIGKRFKKFRVGRKIKQNMMAKELKVNQSTITHIEHGKTFPKIKYLQYFHRNYFLNINWLVTGEGEMYTEDFNEVKGASILKFTHIKEKDQKYHKYEELIELIQIPSVEEQLLAWLNLLKVFLKDDVQEFREKKGKEEESRTTEKFQPVHSQR